MVKAGKEYEAGAPAQPALMAAIGALTQEMIQAGVVLDIGGLLPSSHGARIHAAGSKLTVIDGPFAEAKELIGGFAILQAKSKEEAIEWGSRFLRVQSDALGDSYTGEMEIRQMHEPSQPCGTL